MRVGVCGRPLLHPQLLRRHPPIQAVGLQGLIQATRDTTATVFFGAKPVVLPLIVAVLLYGGVSAWQEGKKYSENARGAQLTQRDLGLLALCVLIDVVGDSSWLLGASSDLFWAPCSALLLQLLFDAPLLAATNFFKEILPFTDVLPVASLAWLFAYAYPESRVAKTFGLERLRPEDADRDEDDFFL